MLDQSMVAWFQRCLIRMRADVNITPDPESPSAPDEGPSPYPIKENKG